MVSLQILPLIFSLVFEKGEAKMEPFIVGGVHRSISDFPHCIFLAVDCSSRWICGASILNQNIIITAAHCVDACNIKNEDHLIEAFAGHENLLKEDKPDQATVLKAVSQKIRSKRVCSQIGILEPGMLCAGSTKEDTHHPADGDSGSALISKDYIELSLVSYGVCQH